MTSPQDLRGQPQVADVSLLTAEVRRLRAEVERLRAMLLRVLPPGCQDAAALKHPGDFRVDL